RASIVLACALLAAAGATLSSCSSFTDCSARRDCPPGSQSGASTTSGSSGMSGTLGGASGKGGGFSSGAGNSGDGGADAAAGSGGAPPPMCDGTLSPDVDACVVSDEYGVFVSPTGIDAGADGTQAHPFATVSAALAHISKIKHVYVCVGDGDYLEPDTLQIPDRVSIYGGFTCVGGTWKYDSATPAHLISSQPIGAMITNAKVGVVIQDLRLDAANAPEDGTGANSFGLMISGSQGVALKRVEIRAGKGGKGKSGADGATGVDGADSGASQNGAAGNCSPSVGTLAGPSPVSKQCDSEGGNGGAARVGKDYAASQDGGSGYLVSPTNGGKGADLIGNNADPGKPGGNGARGENGTVAPPLGTFSESGYKVASGGSASAGKAGQGGGGGGASLGTASCLGATGGAGGMGGCGGDPG